MMTSPNPSRAVFPNSRWSLVVRRADSSAPAHDALSDLAQRYGYPVYAYLRCEHPAEIAREMTRTFLQQMVSGFGRKTIAAKASIPFRVYLLERLHTFTGDRTANAAPDTALPDLPDMESRYAHDHPAPVSPERGFQHAFAREVLYRALIRLREEAEQTGRLDMFTALEPFLARDPESEICERISAALHTGPLVLMIALKRLRQRLRELTGEELADTIDDPAHLSAEQDLLLGFLRSQPADATDPHR